MDPLSDVLSLLKPYSHASGGFAAGGPWAIQFPPHDGIKCYAVVTGACWLAVAGVADAVHLTVGDCFLLPAGRPFRLASDLAVAPVHASAGCPSERNGGTAVVNGAGTSFSSAVTLP